jgi:hypothetical protein
MHKHKISSKDDIVINGNVYYIPDKYTDSLQQQLGIEQILLYKLIFAMIIDSNLKVIPIELLNKKHMEKYNQLCDKIFSYIITGKLDIVEFSNLEKEVIDKIPISLIPKLNPIIVERML